MMNQKSQRKTFELNENLSCVPIPLFGRKPFQTKETRSFFLLNFIAHIL
jgi:hypothetical protein